jgi:hypothetical protein
MAGYERIYLFGGVGGYMGADGMNPIAMQIWVGWSDRKWLEAHYFVDDLEAIGGIKAIIPKQHDEELNLLEASIIFGPQFYIMKCDLMEITMKYFSALNKTKIDLADDAPEFWDDVVKQARPVFNTLNVFQADLKEISKWVDAEKK